MAEGHQASSRCQRAGQYANSFKVGHNAFEFVIEFGQRHAGAGREHTHTRIITGPEYAKALAALLTRSLGRYEKTFGLIGNRGRRRPGRD
jgi:hypothetical protein